MKKEIWWFYMILVAGCLIGLYQSAHAAELDAVLGVGIGKNVVSHRPFERMGELGVQYGSSWVVRANGGYWMATDIEDTSSYFGSLQGGLQVQGAGGTYANMLFGPAFVTNPDYYKNSGVFGFNLSAAIGVKNSVGYGLAFCWNHWSDAGLTSPNNGRDILTANLIIPIWRASGRE